VKEWKYEVCYHLEVNGKTVAKHRPDFTVWFPDGRVEVNEVKGGLVTQTDGWRVRRKLFEALFPHIKYRVFDGRGTWRRARV